MARDQPADLTVADGFATLTMPVPVPVPVHVPVHVRLRLARELLAVLRPR